MNSEADTLPNIQTVLERIEALAVEMRSGFSSVNARLDGIEHQLEQMDIRFDRLESEINKTRSEMLNFRADFKEFRSQSNQPA
jgi:archaellum component FlaC